MGARLSARIEQHSGMWPIFFGRNERNIHLNLFMIPYFTAPHTQWNRANSLTSTFKVIYFLLWLNSMGVSPSCSFFFFFPLLLTYSSTLYKACDLTFTQYQVIWVALTDYVIGYLCLLRALHRFLRILVKK